MENAKDNQIHSIKETEILIDLKNVIEAEYLAIKKQLDIIDERFIKAVHLISKLKGKIAFSGVGKSRYVAMKLASSFSSLSIPSFFIDPLDAFHGDIGSLSKDDIVFLLSYSGKTKELVELLIESKRREILTISLTSNTDSFIYSNSDVSLRIKPVKEACFMGLAPSSSVVAMLSLGDAIGFCAAKLRGTTHRDFAKNHPSGFLGVKTKKVEDIMKPLNKTPYIFENDTLAKAIEKMTSSKIGAVCIVDEELNLIGFFTDGDLRRRISQKNISLDMPIKEIMTKYPITAKRFMTVENIIRKMNDFGFDNIPVVDENGKLIGIVDERDILKF